MLVFDLPDGVLAIRFLEMRSLKKLRSQFERIKFFLAPFLRRQPTTVPGGI